MDQVRAGMAIFCLVLAISSGAASAAGVFLRGDGSTASAASIRGETFRYATDGIYRFNAERVVAEGVGWDYVTLLFAVPSLLLAVRPVFRGSFRGRLFAMGLMAYLFYQYLQYAMYWAFGPLFPAFIVLFSASLAGLLWFASSFELAAMPSRFSGRFPRRAMAIMSAAMSLVLLGMWVPMIAKGMRGDIQGLLFGQTTMVVQALDLGLLVPLMVLTTIATWRRMPIGFLLSAVFVVKAAAMGLAICAMLISAWMVQGRLEFAPFVLFFVASLGAATIGVCMYRSVLPSTAG
jgi:hypothetical protein